MSLCLCIPYISNMLTCNTAGAVGHPLPVLTPQTPLRHLFHRHACRPRVPGTPEAAGVIQQYSSTAVHAVHAVQQYNCEAGLDSCSCLWRQSVLLILGLLLCFSVIYCTVVRYVKVFAVLLPVLLPGHPSLPYPCWILPYNNKHPVQLPTAWPSLGCVHLAVVPHNCTRWTQTKEDSV